MICPCRSSCGSIPRDHESSLSTDLPGRPRPRGRLVPRRATGGPARSRPTGRGGASLGPGGPRGGESGPRRGAFGRNLGGDRGRNCRGARRNLPPGPCCRAGASHLDGRALCQGGHRSLGRHGSHRGEQCDFRRGNPGGTTGCRSEYRHHADRQCGDQSDQQTGRTWRAHRGRCSQHDHPSPGRSRNRESAKRVGHVCHRANCRRPDHDRPGTGRTNRHERGRRLAARNGIGRERQPHPRPRARTVGGRHSPGTGRRRCLHRRPRAGAARTPRSPRPAQARG